ncbi:MAG: TlpA disulfide reductase family protein [Pirellulales bacterium]
MQERRAEGIAQRLGLVVWGFAAVIGLSGVGCHRPPSQSEPAQPVADQKPGNTSSASGATADPGTASSASAAGQTLEGPVAEKLRYPVPEGSPQELLEFIAEISKRAPEGKTVDDKSADLTQLLIARVRAADKILLGGPIPDIRMTALETKLDALRALAIVDPEGYGKEFQPFAKTLIDSHDESEQLLGRVALMRSNVEMIGNGLTTDTDAVMKELRALLTERRQEPMVFWAAVYAGSVFQELGFADLTQEIYGTYGEAFQGSTVQDVADEAKVLIDQAKFAVIKSHAAAAMKGDPQALDQLTKAIDELLAQASDASNTLGLCMQTANMFEFAGQLEPAKRLYAAVLAKYGQHADPTLAESVRRSVELAGRRLELAGKPLVIEGVKADGEPFDWNTLAGKRVLVDFWTSDSGIELMPEVREAYRLYHDRGLEVVGVCLDEKADQRQAYLKAKPLPWVTVVSADSEHQGMNDPNAVRYGVEMVPFRVLVDTDGKVTDWNLFGDRLAEKLKSIYGETTAPTP